MEDPTRDDWFAPAHDVLEDWAVLQWIGQEFDTASREWSGFISRLGTEPAIRRAVRLWVAEYLSVAPADPGADSRILAVALDLAVQAHWRHDLLVGVLVSDQAERFLRRNRDVLTADRCWLLRNVLHVVRVACRCLPERRVPDPGLAPLGLVPDGPAWGVLAEFLADRGIAESMPSGFWISFRFVQDWIDGVRDGIEYPAGSPHVAAIASRLLEQTKGLDYNVRDKAARFLISVLFTLPNNAEDTVMALTEEAVTSDARGHADAVREVVLSHFSGGAAARDRPELVFKVLEHAWGVGDEEDDETHPWTPREPDTVERAFGFPRHSRLDHFPASALQGPWWNLFRHHPTETLAVLIRLVNRACQAYATSPRDLERASELAVRLPDGSAPRLLGNSRIYCLYRGTSVGPYALQSALMALERWLLDRGAAGEATLAEDLERLLCETNNVALAGVVVSVATAYPALAGKAALPILTCPEFFDVDRGRWVHDQTSPSRYLEYTSGDSQDRILAEERVQSASLPHRKEELETLCIRLQMTQAREEVWKVIDAHRAELPVPESQTEDQKMWRLVLHRCDLRRFEEAEDHQDGGVAYRSREPASDIKAVLDGRADAIAEMNTESHLFVWATSVFEGAADPAYPATAWKEMMASAREHERSRTAIRGPGAFARVAAMCARDHWQDMDSESRSWCLAKLDEATNDADPTGYGMVVDGAREAALVLPLLAADSSDDTRPILLDATLRAFTHGDANVQLHAAVGIGRYLWPRDARLGRGLVVALLEFTEVERLRFEQEDDHENKATERALCRSSVRHLIENEVDNDLTGRLQLDYHQRPWRFIVNPLCALLRHLPEEECARSFFAHVFGQLVAGWASDGRVGPRGRWSDSFDPALEHNLEDRLAEFCLQLPPTVLERVLPGLADAVQAHAEKVAGFTKDLIIAQFERDDAEAFWHLWQQIADALVANTSIKRIRRKHTGDARLAETLLLLRIHWVDSVTSWKPLDGEEHRLVTLFDALPPSAEVVAAFVHFLYKFGRGALPDALVNVASKLNEQQGLATLSSTAASWLEVLLGRLVYAGHPRLREEKQIREATISILDSLVDSGSSAAYRIRDDFLTPVRSPTSSAGNPPEV